jgi:hypothetical protein
MSVALCCATAACRYNIIINNILYLMYRRTTKSVRTLCNYKQLQIQIEELKCKKRLQNNTNSHLGIPIPTRVSGTIKIHILEFQSKKVFKNSKSNKNRIH